MGIGETIDKAIQMQVEILVAEKDAEIKKLRETLNSGEIGNMAWLKEFIGLKSEETIKNKILMPYKKQLENKIVKYPTRRGNPWYFNKAKMSKWLYDNFERLEL